MIRSKAGARPKALKTVVSASFSDPDLTEICAKQMWQILQASLAVAPYYWKDFRVRDFLYAQSR